MELKIETIVLTDLQLDPSNARKHSTRNIDVIAKSLQEFGQRKPIVISKDNTVIAGNGTVVAAKQIGWKGLSAVRIPSEWTDAQIKAYAIADNRSAELAEWDGAGLLDALQELKEENILSATGFDENELDDLLKVWGTMPTINDLLNNVGDVTEDDGLERVSFKAPPDVASKWAQLIKNTNGNTELDKICNLINNVYNEHKKNV
jgi:hypothetical protein